MSDTGSDVVLRGFAKALVASLDSLYGEGAWREEDAYNLAQSILAAAEQARA